MADDLMIEVTGSAKNAESALDKVISKLSALQQTFEKLSPSLTAFIEKMNSLATSSKAMTALKAFTDSTSKSALSAKDAESKMAMYQARLDRATLSMDKSRVASEKLASAQKKLKESAGIDAANTAFLNNFQYKGFSNEASKFNNTAAPDLGTPDIPTPPIGSARLASDIMAERAAKSPTPSFSINNSGALSAIDQMRAYIDKIAPSISNMSAEAQAEFEKLSAELFRISAQIDNQRALYHQLSSAATQAANATGEGSTKYLQLEKRLLSTDGAIDKLIAKQDKLKAQMSGISGGTSKVSSGLKSFGDSAEKSSSKATSGFQKTLQMMEKMFIRILAFRIFSAVQQAITDGFNNMAQGSSQANAVLSQLSTSSLYLKNSIAASLMPTIQAMTPFIVELIDHLSDLFNMIAMLTARIFNNASTVTIAKKASVDYAASIAKTGDAAKDAQKSILGFDELNTLSKPQTSANNGMPDFKDMFETVKIPQNVLSVADKIKSIIDKIKKSLADITAVVSGALIAVGAILLFTGANIPLGLGLMAVGAVGLASVIMSNWDSMTTPLLNTLTAITSAVGGFLLALGAILAFSGVNIPLGIGLMAAGAVSLATSVGINWNSTKTNVSTVLSGITGLVSGAVLALGAVLAFSGANVPLGIGLMVVGAVGIASTIALNWSGISNQTKETISTITGIVGGSLLALGAILALTGASVPLGIAMIAVGASVLATTIAINWDSMSPQLRNTLTIITGIVGGASLALGAILAFTGVGIPLGVALMGIGAASLVTSVALNWSSVKDSIKGVLADILAIASTAGVAIGLMLCLTGAGIPLGIGLIMAGMKGISTASSISTTPITKWAKDLMNGVIGVFEEGINYIIGMLNKLSFTVPDWVNGIGGEKYGINISPVRIPRLASGGLVTAPTYSLIGEGNDNEAVIPLNTQVFSSLAKGIVENGGASSGYDTERIVNSIGDLKSAIQNIQIFLYANDSEIAKSANRGGSQIDRRFNPIAQR